MLNQLIKRFYRLLIALYKTNIFKLFKYFNQKSTNIIWIRDNSLKYLFTTSFLWDLATIRAFIEKGCSFKVVTGLHIGNSVNNSIFYTLHPRLGVFGFSDYTSDIHYVVGKLSENNNILFPSLNEALLWENKAYMHKVFDEKDIPTPKTKIETVDSIDYNKLKFPFLLKEVHSCESKGLYKIGCMDDFMEYINGLDVSRRSQPFLMQEILNMRKDLRVIVIDGCIEHYYWRINLSDKWRPTATSKGNKIEFKGFPEHHRDTIIQFAKRLNLSSAAFDITWQNDDLNSIPIVLEVSPAFSPNPIVTSEFDLMNYGNFKKKIELYGYDYSYVNLIFKLKRIHLGTVNIQN